MFNSIHDFGSETASKFFGVKADISCRHILYYPMVRGGQP